ncbi:MAG: hypothetical protein U0641_20450 [Anaerolineae bacterium]
MPPEMYVGETDDLANALIPLQAHLREILPPDHPILAEIADALTSRDVVKLRAAYDATEELPDPVKIELMRREMDADAG